MRDVYGIGSATDAEEITPSDTVDIEPVPYALYVGTAGDLAVEMKGGTVATLKNAFGLLPVSARKILETGTTAQDIVGLR